MNFCLFKRKSAYEMRISDWSSDVCSSGLLEAAGGAESLHRRRREYGDHGFLDGAELPVELRGDGLAAQRRALAFVEGLQGHEHDAGVRAVGEPVDGQPGDCDRALDARLLQGDIAHAADHGLGSAQGRGISTEEGRWGTEGGGKGRTRR